MKKKLIQGISLLTVLGFCAFSIGCAGSAREQSTGEFIDSATIQTKVKAALMDDPDMKGSDISVDVFKSNVILKGVALSDFQRRRAEELAWNVAGVQKVEDNILVAQPPARTSNAGAPSGGTAAGAAAAAGSSISVAGVLANPSDRYGQTVSVRGNVAEVVSPNAFVLSDLTDKNRSILVTAKTSDVNSVREGDTIEVNGALNQFDLQQEQRNLNATFNEDRFREWRDQPSVEAQSIRLIQPR